MRANEIITERIAPLNKDIDNIYKMYMMTAVQEINTWKIKQPTFKHVTRETSVTMDDLIKLGAVTHPRIIAANKANPITLGFYGYFDGGGNMYVPDYNNGSRVSLDLNRGAYVQVMDAAGWDASQLKSVLGRQYDRWMAEFTETKAKGSINHELAHWLDDTENNFHIGRKIQKYNDAGMSSKAANSLKQGHDSINVTDFEVHGQMHNILRLKKRYAKEWDTLTFDEMVALQPSLVQIASTLTAKDQPVWRKKVMRRMAREKLLGKNMR